MDDTRTLSRKAESAFVVTGWTEQVVADVDGTGTRTGDAYYPDRGFTHVEASYRYHGALEGTSQVAYLIGYRAGGAAPVVGFERFEGSLDGRVGSFVLRHDGEQDAGAVRARLEVVPGLGTGELASLRGEADLHIEGHREDGYPLVLVHDLS